LQRGQRVLEISDAVQRDFGCPAEDFHPQMENALPEEQSQGAHASAWLFRLHEQSNSVDVEWTALFSGVFNLRPNQMK
jgi:hypothetical protein